MTGDVSRHQSLTSIGLRPLNGLISQRPKCFGERFVDTLGGVHSRDSLHVRFELGNDHEDLAWGNTRPARRPHRTRSDRARRSGRNHPPPRHIALATAGWSCRRRRLHRCHAVFSPSFPVTQRRDVSVEARHTAEHIVGARPRAGRNATHVVGAAKGDPALAGTTNPPRIHFHSVLPQAAVFWASNEKGPWTVPRDLSRGLTASS